jgi:hypothetical protein
MKRHRHHLFFAAAISVTLLVLLQYQTQVLGEDESEAVRAPVAAAERLPSFNPPEPDPVPTLTSRLEDADRLLAEERWIAARDLLSDGLTAADAIDPEVRSRLERISDLTFFSRRYVPGDPFTGTYTVQPGDSLERIVRRLDLAVDWRLLQRVNGLRDASHVRFGQQLKVVRGPFHVRVDKSEFRADVFAGPVDEPERWIYVRSFPVGLGSGGLTPVGTFVVKDGGKVVDPFWTDPRSGNWYGPGDPQNPIGDRWIGIEGVGEYAALQGYGFHGTLEPESVGGEGSLGCIRLLPDDVGRLYELLGEGRSVIEIRP